MNSSIPHILIAGTPPQISPEGILDDTTEPAAIIELRPITVPGNNIVCAPTKTLSPISTVPSFVTPKETLNNHPSISTVT